MKILSANQTTLVKFIIKQTEIVECQYCRQNIHRRNLQLHVDIKCPVRNK